MVIIHIESQVHVIFFSRFEQKWPTGGHFVFIMFMPVSLECNDCLRSNLVHRQYTRRYICPNIFFVIRYNMADSWSFLCKSAKSSIFTCPELFLRDDWTDLDQSWHGERTYWVTDARHCFSRFKQKWLTSSHFVFIVTVRIINNGRCRQITIEC